MPYFENLREYIVLLVQVTLSSGALCFVAIWFASIGSVPSTRAQIRLEAVIQIPVSRPYPPLSRHWVSSKSAVARRTGPAACLRRLYQIETSQPMTFHPGSATRS